MGVQMNIWRLVTHHADPERALNWARQSGRVAIGWGAIGDLRQYASSQDISRAISRHYPTLRNQGSGGVCLDNFCYAMRPGDLVILSAGGVRAATMVIKGGYEFMEKPEEAPIGDYQHQRQGQLIPIDPNRLWTLVGPPEHNIRWTLVRLQRRLTDEERDALVD